MNAFRFLSLLTVGFSLLVLVFLLNATQGRLESEAFRVLEGPEVALEPGQTAQWTLELGGSRIEEAWPAAQRQPRIFLVGDPSGGLGDASVAVSATYVDEDDTPRSAFVSGAAEVTGVAGEDPGELEFGPLWMNWEQELQLEVRVLEAVASGGAGASGEAGASGGAARLVMRGEASLDYLAARSMARTLWFVFTAIAAAGFAGLMLTVREDAAAASQRTKSPPQA
ncbi:hypothetical protein Poly30_19890 [Planctomycetes bacterium Poly30]|uniref:Uncharacterized protein n=1 Tax=Saltatorellus ferox TaxID=2528018 RepID=A0A518EQW6_9BACT|nr:hypothetical protein Poly30_19890 [Planctomycetes bacterium Poly30]